MPRVSSRNAYQHVSDFDKGQIVVYRDCDLLYRSVAARVGRDPVTDSRIWNRLVQDAVLDFNDSLSLAAKKKGMLPAWS
ncbi:hypothetical protein TNCV_2473861 [Trichonephila clavipes]|nr:hypothetical protein TNCV_2473861 [Trichonephila clavipes]